MGSLAVVYDTNVLVSGIGFYGKPWESLLLAFVGDVEMVTSAEALSEFRRVLGYEHLPFSEEERSVFPALIRREATIVDPDVDLAVVDEDPDDDKFFECAVGAGADFLLTGNDHVRGVGEFRGVKILRPAEFLARHS